MRRQSACGGFPGGILLYPKLAWHFFYWRWGESNPRPKLTPDRPLRA